MVFIKVSGDLVVEILPAQEGDLTPPGYIAYSGVIPTASVLKWDPETNTIIADLTQDKEDKKNEIQEELDEILGEGYESIKGIKLQSTPLDVMLYDGGIRTDQKIGSPNTIFRDYDKNMVVMDINEADTLITELALYVRYAFGKQWEAEQLIEAAETMEDLEAVNLRQLILDGLDDFKEQIKQTLGYTTDDSSETTSTSEGGTSE